MPRPIEFPQMEVPEPGRVHTLRQTGAALYMLGLAVRPLPRYKVLRIERRALEKLRSGIQQTLRVS